MEAQILRIHRKGVSRGSREQLGSFLHPVGADFSSIELVLESQPKEENNERSSD